MNFLKRKPVLVFLSAIAMLSIFIITAAPAAVNIDPISSTSVSVEVGTLASGYFNGFSGLGTESETIMHKIATKGKEIISYLPGRLTTNQVELTRNGTEDMDFYNWRKLVEDGNMTAARKEVTVVLYDQSMQPVAKWVLTNAWPCKIRYDMEDGGLFTEKVTLVYEKIQRVQP